MTSNKEYSCRIFDVPGDDLGWSDNEADNRFLISLATAWTAVLYHMNGSTHIDYGIFQIMAGSGDVQQKSKVEIAVAESPTIQQIQQIIGHRLDLHKKVEYEGSADGSSIIFAGPTDKLDALKIDDVTQKPSYVVLVDIQQPGRVKLLTSKTKVDDRLTESYVSRLNEAISNLSRRTKNDLRDLCAPSTRDAAPLRAKITHALDEELCLHELIKRQSTRQPNALAVSAWDGNLTYQELETSSRAFSSTLRDLGCSDSRSVIHCMAHSKWAIVAYLGIIRAGHVCVPLDPNTPIQRIEEVVKITDAHVISCDESLGIQMKEKIEHVITSRTDGISELPQKNLEPTVSPSSTLLIIFTSGSSGTPKGVVQQHSRVSTGLVATSKALSLGGDTRFLNFASYSFDASVNEIFAPLVAGGCVCIPSEEQRLQDISSFIRDHHVTHACLTTTVASKIEPSSVPSLKQLSLGGEMASRALLESWADQVQLNILYGSTEGAVWDTIATAVAKDSDPSNIGFPIESDAWIVHPEDIDSLTPFCSIGQLYIQSDLLSVAYIGQGSSTPTHITTIPNWMTEEHRPPGSELYATGDLARFNADGSIILLGRMDSQTKIHGQRIDLGDIEHRLAEHLEETSDVIVDVVGSPEDKRLIAFVGGQSRKYSESSHSNLKKDLEGSMDKMRLNSPRYMVPETAVAVTNIPKTASMKVDRKRLQEIGHEQQEQQRTDCLKALKTGCDAKDELFGAIKELICNLVSPNDERLVRSVRNHDIGLRQFGVSSIQAVTLARLIRKEFQVELSVSSMLTDSVTCWDLRDAIHEKLHSGNTGEPNQDLYENMSEWKRKLSSLLLGEPEMVFVTGATGFLGNEILRQLLQSTRESRIIAHVRAETIKTGLSRVRSAAERRGWWTSAMEGRLEVWLGDLSKSKLGLSNDRWNSLFKGQHDVAIIHNGAVVDWVQSYSSLQQTNVQSTFELLSGLISSEKAIHLTYVSGGYLSPVQETEDILVQKLSDWPGYDQTKFICEALIKQYNQHMKKGDARIVKPGYIVGTQDNGESPRGDTFWRLLKSCARIGFYSESDAGSWVTLSGVSDVAQVVVDDAIHHASMDNVREETKILDGVPFNAIWAVLNTYGISVRPLMHTRWLDKILDDITNEKEKHPLYPLQDWITQSQGLLGGDRPDRAHLLFKAGQIQRCVEASVRTMVEGGLFDDAGGSA